MPKTILLADDSVTIRKVVELTFSESEYRVESVGSGQEALERLETLDPDLVLADVVMPEPGGYDLCRRVKKSDRPVPVLLLAGTFEPFDEEQARQCGADGHLVKPFESGSLLERVEALLRAPTSAAAPVEEESSAASETGEDEFEEVLDDLASVVTESRPSEQASEAREATAETGTEIEEEPGRQEVVAAAVSDEPVRGDLRLSPDELDALTRAVVERLSAAVLREIAWEVVPQLAEVIIKERIRELERTADD
jgi:DNA-binding response OmpR family regulator